ncbi:hypothetical protein NDN08_005236 [Rhodosorus marinus]|uniref:TrmE-type G domain-containing protein n=1 Tax=Rhodosorus marinus TaxID=101924 RepID=A0AAV8V470_9RHOD|nr:hypothetical protein NDN08_005236 [Rhodosorus marinus]
MRMYGFCSGALWKGGKTKIRPSHVTMSMYSDTIYALSTGVGRAGVAVVRVSGADAGTCLLQLCSLEKLPAARKATLRKVIHPKAKEVVDEALVLYFPQPRSFTGEDVAELHVHGSYAVIKSTLEALSLVDPEQGRRIRPAERGEFTRRAFENGRMDLTEVEGLADLIASETTEQRKQALKQMSGHLRQYYESWREQLKSCLAFAEAVIDFGEDVDESALLEILPKATEVVEEMKTHLKDGRRGEIVRSGVKLAIIGPPNAGKSSLLNELARRPAAIVSPIAGTTRDVVQVNLDLGGMSVVVSDTAGIRTQTDDVIEQEGIRRAWATAEEADIVLCVVDASEQSNDGNQWIANDTVNTRKIIVANKADLVGEQKGLISRSLQDVPVRYISCKTGDGIQPLLDELEKIIKDAIVGDTKGKEMPLITRQRHRQHVQACITALETFLEGCEANGGTLPLDIATEELRIATKEIGLVTGIVHVEEVLDVVFSEFCIGK